MGNTLLQCFVLTYFVFSLVSLIPAHHNIKEQVMTTLRKARLSHQTLLSSCSAVVTSNMLRLVPYRCTLMRVYLQDICLINQIPISGTFSGKASSGNMLSKTGTVPRKLGHVVNLAQGPKHCNMWILCKQVLMYTNVIQSAPIKVDNQMAIHIYIS